MLQCIDLIHSGIPGNPGLKARTVLLTMNRLPSLLIVNTVDVTELLREFVRENVRSMFGLNRYVTMNALQDVVGGPSTYSMHQSFQNHSDHSVDTSLKVSLVDNDNEPEFNPGDEEIQIDPVP
jgi:hypothetical protein